MATGEQSGTFWQQTAEEPTNGTSRNRRGWRAALVVCLEVAEFSIHNARGSQEIDHA